MSKNIAVPEDLYNKAAELAAKDQCLGGRVGVWVTPKTNLPTASTSRPGPNYSVGRSSSVR
jgi:hypothetical protein